MTEFIYCYTKRKNNATEEFMYIVEEYFFNPRKLSLKNVGILYKNRSPERVRQIIGKFLRITRNPINGKIWENKNIECYERLPILRDKINEDKDLKEKIMKFIQFNIKNSKEIKCS